MKSRLKKRKISPKTEINILPLKHDRYLARVHTLVSITTSFIVSLFLFLIAGLLEKYFSLDRNVIFIFSLVIALTVTIALTLYLNWRDIRLKCVDRMIDICEDNSDINI